MVRPLVPLNRPVQAHEVSWTAERRKADADALRAAWIPPDPEFIALLRTEEPEQYPF
jgi:hypothetical protein